MHRIEMRPLARPSWTAVFAVFAIFGLTAMTQPAQAVEKRTFSKSFNVSEGETLRLANLAGRVELVPASGSELRVEATVYADRANLLRSMEWVESRDRHGRPEWALSYPVDEYRGFAYPRSGSNDDEDEGFLERLIESFASSGRNVTTYRGKKVSIYGRPSGSAPTLYADLKIAVPSQGAVVVRNAVGTVEGGDLAGDLMVDTGSGGVRLDGFRGKLNVDTGSGSVRLGQVRGETIVDTGSGSIDIAELVGNGNLDTGSGSIRVHRVAAGKLRADTGSGSITVENGTVGILVADTGSGSIRILDVDVEAFDGDTGSGGVTLRGDLSATRDINIDTGSGGVRIYGGPNAAFDIEARQGSGSLSVRYDDATLRKRGSKVVGATRGDRRTKIRVETGSGGCVIAPGE